MPMPLSLHLTKYLSTHSEAEVPLDPRDDDMTAPEMTPTWCDGEYTAALAFAAPYFLPPTTSAYESAAWVYSDLADTAEAFLRRTTREGFESRCAAVLSSTMATFFVLLRRDSEMGDGGGA
ncbi:hypothetical protein E2562_004520 [Oryza meyeriana var. granulata]|uniref:Uncharacterized protein n=1 Tax=Oryza meyeriana var. granulata TaxID=110450 RepID=A0A6G1F3J1_9ORYZ|nr:hypothetical protein E2562_004520 [Oryza meyeriana var. granulata]